MELPKFGSDRGVFSDLKSKLGFSGQGGKADDGYYDDGYDGYDDEYDDYEDGYDDYSDYGSGSDYDRTYTGTRYDSDDAVTTRPARSSSRSDGFPRLVSIDDVRAHTRVPDSLNRDPLPARHVTSASPRRLDREVVSASSPAPSSPAYVAAAAAREAEQSRPRPPRVRRTRRLQRRVSGRRSTPTRRTPVRERSRMIRPVLFPFSSPPHMAMWSAWRKSSRRETPWCFPFAKRPISFPSACSISPSAWQAHWMLVLNASPIRCFPSPEEAR